MLHQHPLYSAFIKISAATRARVADSSFGPAELETPRFPFIGCQSRAPIYFQISRFSPISLIYISSSERISLLFICWGVKADCLNPFAKLQISGHPILSILLPRYPAQYTLLL